MRTAWFDCSSGISGDMLIGALLDAGADFAGLQSGLRKLKLKGFRISAGNTKRHGFQAVKFDVDIPKAHHPLPLSRMEEAIGGSSLSGEIKEKGILILKSLFAAEAKAHGQKVKDVHLHELGSPDTIVDIIGSLICLHSLKIEKVFFSPINVGSGFIKTAHGKLPIPAPATSELLKGIPVYSSGVEFELATPTGAALAKGVSAGFGPMPLMKVDIIGRGAGERNLADTPNILRIFTGETAETANHEEIQVIEANIDDMNPQIYEYVMERFLGAGALDVYLTPVIMKKSRPGIILGVLSRPEDLPILSRIIFEETTTLGIRIRKADRVVLKRKIITKSTPYGRIRFKMSGMDGGETLSPEYEDCKAAARKTGIPLKKILDSLKKS